MKRIIGFVIIFITLCLLYGCNSKEDTNNEEYEEVEITSETESPYHFETDENGLAIMPSLPEIPSIDYESEYPTFDYEKPKKQKNCKVYVTATGSKYHRQDCQYLDNSCYEISEKEAINEGYEPCLKCNP